ncbi:hypothetical protein JDV02_006530 [Purpureocillium takamizusanense]|uniref:Macro domain-containing protein n=1 Tax=Purpureocillium takamizusanense TaxID=2060973 RepID=A0A9Q8QKG3_9HYPO|nr:uncharacterized protein JDV02_006530 [Purpureocillium takamizusanense]UNI20444.1 hypothetical protein JDV02_006530 [Purpureocillium takamizusanense]
MHRSLDPLNWLKQQVNKVLFGSAFSPGACLVPSAFRPFQVHAGHLPSIRTRTVASSFPTLAPHQSPFQASSRHFHFRSHTHQSCNLSLTRPFSVTTMASSAAVKTLADIPTLNDLYLSSSLRGVCNPLADPSAPVNARVSLIRADITKLQLDAIVNAAKTSLLGGGGVDGAIHRAAGESLVTECRRLGGCPTGQAKITKGYMLPAKHVIHTVGPVYDPHNPKESERLLRSCYEESLRLAYRSGVKTIAFSGISTGVYGYPSREAAEVACETVRKFMDQGGNQIERVVFVTFESKDVTAYNQVLPIYFPAA